MDKSPLQEVKSLKQVLARQPTYMISNKKMSGDIVENEVVLDEGIQGRLSPIHKDIYFLTEARGMRREGRTLERILNTMLRRLLEQN